MGIAFVKGHFDVRFNPSDLIVSLLLLGLRLLNLLLALSGAHVLLHAVSRLLLWLPPVVQEISDRLNM